MKILPTGKKADDLNFNPIIGFQCGATFTMSHPHTHDINSLIYQSKFYENGCEKSGYVLKP